MLTPDFEHLQPRKPKKDAINLPLARNRNRVGVTCSQKKLMRYPSQKLLRQGTSRIPHPSRKLLWSRHDFLDRYQLECESDFEYDSSSESESDLRSPVKSDDDMELVLRQVKKVDVAKTIQRIEATIVFHEICDLEGIEIPSEFVESQPWPQSYGGRKNLMVDPVVTKSGQVMSRFMAPLILGRNHNQLLNPKGRLHQQWIVTTSRKHNLLSITDLIETQTSTHLKENLSKLEKSCSDNRKGVTENKLLWASYLTVKYLGRRITNREEIQFRKLKAIERLKINIIRKDIIRLGLPGTVIKQFRHLKEKLQELSNYSTSEEDDEEEEESEYSDSEPDPQKPPRSRITSSKNKKKGRKRKIRKLRSRNLPIGFWTKLRSRPISSLIASEANKKPMTQLAKMHKAVRVTRAFQGTLMNARKSEVLVKKSRTTFPVKSLGLIEIAPSCRRTQNPRSSGSVFKRLHPSVTTNLPAVIPETLTNLCSRERTRPRKRETPLVLFQKSEWQTIDDVLATTLQPKSPPTPPPPPILRGAKGRIMILQNVLQNRGQLMDKIQQAGEEELISVLVDEWNKDGGIGNLDSGDDESIIAADYKHEDIAPIHSEVLFRPDTGGRIRDQLDKLRQGIRHVTERAEQLNDSWQAQEIERRRQQRLIDNRGPLGGKTLSVRKRVVSCKLSDIRRQQMQQQLPYEPTSLTTSAAVQMMKKRSRRNELELHMTSSAADHFNEIAPSLVPESWKRSVVLPTS